MPKSSIVLREFCFAPQRFLQSRAFQLPAFTWPCFTKGFPLQSRWHAQKLLHTFAHL